MENNQTASRAARRLLHERVRDDWDWPDTPPCWSASDEEIRGVTEFRERYYGTTTPSASDTEAEAKIKTVPEPEAAALAQPAANTDPYRFDSPDSIRDAVEWKRQTRKRKRREAQQSEMQWNEGLQCFVERRDVWTGAAAVRKYSTKLAPTESAEAMDDGRATPPTMAPNPDESSSFNNDPADPLIPLALPLLPGNLIRASIKPQTYPDIYNNIVLTSRSPSVPVNLADMTRALVQGWKDHGEWPPKAMPLDPLAGRKKSALVSIKAENGEFLAHHPHVKKGVDSVKRIFHFNGHSHDSSPAPNG
jgi:hypothetical protein